MALGDSALMGVMWESVGRLQLGEVEPDVICDMEWMGVDIADDAADGWDWADADVSLPIALSSSSRVNRDEPPVGAAGVAGMIGVISVSPLFSFVCLCLFDSSSASSSCGWWCWCC